MTREKRTEIEIFLSSEVAIINELVTILREREDDESIARTLAKLTLAYHESEFDLDGREDFFSWLFNDVIENKLPETSSGSTITALLDVDNFHMAASYHFGIFSHADNDDFDKLYELCEFALISA